MSIWDQPFEDLRRPHLEEGKKMSKKDHIKAAKAGKRWQDSDGDGNWYEKGEDVKENRAMARDPEGRKSGRSKQPDPSKDGFTGIGNMSIDQIRKMSARIDKEKKTKKEEVEIEEGMKQARANVGASTCWKGYEAKGTKKKDGKEVPNCVKKEHSNWRSDVGFFNEADCEGGPIKPKKGIKNKITINPEIKTEQVMGGPVMKPGSGLGGGKPSYPPNAKKPAPTGAKLPQIALANSYDPMEDPDFDHDEAERTRGQSGKNKSIGGKKKQTRKEEVEQINERPYQVYGSPDGKKEKKIGKPVKSGKYAGARAAELSDTHRATGGKYRVQKEEVEQIDENPLALGAAMGVAAGGAYIAKKAYDTATAMKEKKDAAMKKAQGLNNSFEPEGEEISEREMTAADKKKEGALKKKYDDSGMKASMKKQYGEEEGKKIYFATIRKKAMEAIELEEKVKCEKCHGEGCKHCDNKGYHAEEKKGLYANIHAKRRRGEPPAKPGDEDYPAKDAFKKAAKTAKKEEVEFSGNYEGPLYSPHPDIEEGYKEIDKKRENRMYRRAGNLARKSLVSRGREKEEAQNKSAKIVSAISSQKERERFARMGDEKARSNYKEAAEAELDYYLESSCGSSKPAKKKKSKVAEMADKILERWDEPGERKYGKKYDRFRKPKPKEGKDYGGMRDEKPINRSVFDPPSMRDK